MFTELLMQLVTFGSNFSCFPTLPNAVKFLFILGLSWWVNTGKVNNSSSDFLGEIASSWLLFRDIACSAVYLAIIRAPSSFSLTLKLLDCNILFRVQTIAFILTRCMTLHRPICHNAACLLVSTQSCQINHVKLSAGTCWVDVFVCRKVHNTLHTYHTILPPLVFIMNQDMFF